MHSLLSKMTSDDIAAVTSMWNIHARQIYILWIDIISTECVIQQFKKMLSLWCKTESEQNRLSVRCKTNTKIPVRFRDVHRVMQTRKDNLKFLSDIGIQASETRRLLNEINKYNDQYRIKFKNDTQIMKCILYWNPRNVELTRRFCQVYTRMWMLTSGISSWFDIQRQFVKIFFAENHSDNKWDEYILDCTSTDLVREYRTFIMSIWASTFLQW